MREGNRLTALEVSKRRTPGRYSDGHGLWLQISQSGTKAWLFRYMINGRARHMGLGPLHTVNLAEARVRARQARQLILDGKDPIEVKYAARSAFAPQTTCCSKMQHGGSSSCMIPRGEAQDTASNGAIRCGTTPTRP